MNPKILNKTGHYTYANNFQSTNYTSVCDLREMSFIYGPSYQSVLTSFSLFILCMYLCMLLPRWLLLICVLT